MGICALFFVTWFGMLACVECFNVAIYKQSQPKVRHNITRQWNRVVNTLTHTSRRKRNCQKNVIDSESKDLDIPVMRLPPMRRLCGEVVGTLERRHLIFEVNNKLNVLWFIRHPKDVEMDN
jgi:hypothetical protein